MSCYLVFANFDTLRFLSVFGFQGTIACIAFHAVGLSGLEPPTSRLSGVRSNRLSYKPIITIQLNIAHGYRGDKGIRTLDPLLARQVLSQLSYTPINPAATCSPMPSPA